MSLNSGAPGKQRLRAELKKLCAQYDGPIIRKRDDGRVVLVCCLCTHRRIVDVGYALQFKPKCKCGAEMKAAW